MGKQRKYSSQYLKNMDMSDEEWSRHINEIKNKIDNPTSRGTREYPSDGLEQKKINGKWHVWIQCSETGNYYWKLRSEYNAQMRKDPNHKFVSREWACIDSKYKGLRRFIKTIRKKRQDARRRPSESNKKFLETDITIDFLERLWERQGKRCAYTDKKMQLFDDERRKISMDHAFLCRIDPDIGYTKKNVKFVLAGIGFGKNAFSHKEICSFLARLRVDDHLSFKRRIRKFKKNGDIFAPFKFALQRIKRNIAGSNKFVRCDLTYGFLYALWHSQGGVCPYTGHAMELEISQDDRDLRGPCVASIDRIDSSLGYLEGNVHFVTQFANFAKRDRGHKEALDFFRMVNIGDQEDHGVKNLMLESFGVPVKRVGIYFLLSNDVIVYIGESSNVLKRLQNHLYTPAEFKKFDRVVYLPMGNPDWRKALEKRLIRICQPKYNKDRGVRGGINQFTRSVRFTHLLQLCRTFSFEVNIEMDNNRW